MTQAERLIVKFGGACNLARLLQCAPSTVYRWTYPKEKGGTGGLLPTGVLPELLALARVEGVYLTQADLDPRDF